MNDDEKTELADITYLQVRDVWRTEDRDFTPWVASEKGLALLGRRLGLSLSKAETEVEVGPFRADVVCTDGEGSTVVIENQLEPTDHDHLGKLLTYSAGLRAPIVIWVATEFQEEHRAALERLNEITDEDSLFFGMEIEVLQINGSPPAPRFNVASKPNYWSMDSRLVRRGPRKVSPTNRTNERFWEQFADYIKRAPTEIKAGTPRAQHFMDFRIGRTGANLSAVRLTEDKRIRVELTLTGETHDHFYRALEPDREAIQREIESGELRWDLRDARASVELYADMDPSDESNWKEQMAWMLKKLELFDSSFRNRVKRIKAPN